MRIMTRIYHPSDYKTLMASLYWEFRRHVWILIKRIKGLSYYIRILIKMYLSKGLLSFQIGLDTYNDSISILFSWLISFTLQLFLMLSLKLLLIFLSIIELLLALYSFLTLSKIFCTTRILVKACFACKQVHYTFRRIFWFLWFTN